MSDLSSSLSQSMSFLLDFLSPCPAEEGLCGQTSPFGCFFAAATELPLRELPSVTQLSLSQHFSQDKNCDPNCEAFGAAAESSVACTSFKYRARGATFVTELVTKLGPGAEWITEKNLTDFLLNWTLISVWLSLWVGVFFVVVSFLVTLGNFSWCFQLQDWALQLGVVSLSPTRGALFLFPGWINSGTNQNCTQRDPNYPCEWFKEYPKCEAGHWLCFTLFWMTISAGCWKIGIFWKARWNFQTREKIPLNFSWDVMWN